MSDDPDQKTVEDEPFITHADDHDDNGGFADEEVPPPKKKKKKKKKTKKRDEAEEPLYNDDAEAGQDGVDNVTTGVEGKSFNEVDDSAAAAPVEDEEEAAPPKKKKKKKKKKKTQEEMEEPEAAGDGKFDGQDDHAVTIHDEENLQNGGEMEAVDEDGNPLEAEQEEEKEEAPKGFFDRFLGGASSKKKAENDDDDDDDDDKKKDEEDDEENDVHEEKARLVTREEADAVQSLPFTTYFTHDPIENLRLKVTVRPAPPDNSLEDNMLTHKGRAAFMASKKLEMDVTATQEGQQLSKSLQSHRSRNEDNNNDDEKEYSENTLNNMTESERKKKKVYVDEVGGEQEIYFTWQQKRFTAREVLSYVRDRQRPDTSLANKYSTLIKEKVLDLRPEEHDDNKSNTNAVKLAAEWAENIDGYHIGSYVEEDGYVNPLEYAHLPTVSHRTEQNPLATRVLNARMHKGHPGSVHTRELDYQSMFLVASVDLKKGRAITSINRWKKAQSYGSEVVLGEVRAYGNGTFEVSPGLAPKQKEHPMHALLNKTLDKSRADATKDGSMDPDEADRTRKEQNDVAQEMALIGGEPNEETGWHTFIAPKSKVKYWYKIENVAQPDEQEDTLKSKLALDAKLQAMLGEDDDGANVAARSSGSNDFEKSPNEKGQVRLNCFGEIVRAYGFDDNDGENLYINYELYFDGRWIWSSSDRYHRTKATTQTAEIMATPCDEGMGEETPGQDLYAPGIETLQANFSFPFEFELVGQEGHVHKPKSEELDARAELDALLGRERAKEEPVAEEEEEVDEEGNPIEKKREPHMHDPPLKYPVMYFEVCSLDAWKRHRVVGYGYTVIPNEAGSHVVQVKTWVPVGTLRAQVDRFFVGGSPSLVDIKLSGGPVEDVNVGMGLGMGKTHRTNLRGFFLNKGGWRSESSGTIELRINCLQTRHNPQDWVVERKAKSNSLASWKPFLKPRLQQGRDWANMDERSRREANTERRVDKLRGFAREVGHRH